MVRGMLTFRRQVCIAAHKAAKLCLKGGAQIYQSLTETLWLVHL